MPQRFSMADGRRDRHVARDLYNSCFKGYWQEGGAKDETSANRDYKIC